MIERDMTEGPAIRVVEREAESVCSYKDGKVVLRSKGMSTPRFAGVSSYEPLADSMSLPWSGMRLGEDNICLFTLLSYLS
jgi:hypothetical protein